MKYLKQFMIILCFTFLGDMCHHFLPLPIPSSIYGIILLFLSLHLHIISLEQIKETGAFLVEIMPIMFIPAAIGLLDIWPLLKTNLVAYIVIIVASTVIVMATASFIVQRMVRKS